MLISGSQWQKTKYSHIVKALESTPTIDVNREMACLIRLLYKGVSDIFFYNSDNHVLSFMKWKKDYEKPFKFRYIIHMKNKQNTKTIKACAIWPPPLYS